MRDHRLSAFLILLIFSASLSQGQKIKANNRRSSGLVPFPRIGRNSDLTNLPRSDRAAGLVHYPRVGRSELTPLSPTHFNRLHDAELDADPEFYAGRDVDLDATLDQDYEGYPPRAMGSRHLDKVLKDFGRWTPERPHAIKDYWVARKADQAGSLYPDVRGARNNQGQLAVSGGGGGGGGDYPPRSGRENDRDISTSFL